MCHGRNGHGATITEVGVEGGKRWRESRELHLLHGHEKARGLIQNRAGWAHHAGVGVARGKTR